MNESIQRWIDALQPAGRPSALEAAAHAHRIPDEESSGGEYYVRVARELIEHGLARWGGYSRRTRRKAGLYRLPQRRVDREARSYSRGLYPIESSGSAALDLERLQHIHADGEAPVSGGSYCALCLVYRRDPVVEFLGDDPATACAACPLALSRDGVPCDQPRPDEEDAPWQTWISRDATRPMLDALRKALRYVDDPGNAGYRARNRALIVGHGSVALAEPHILPVDSEYRIAARGGGQGLERLSNTLAEEARDTTYHEVSSWLRSCPTADPPV